MLKCSSCQAFLCASLQLAFDFAKCELSLGGAEGRGSDPTASFWDPAPRWLPKWLLWAWLGGAGHLLALEMKCKAKKVPLVCEKVVKIPAGAVGGGFPGSLGCSSAGFSCLKRL